jgi:hypothetical protein
MYGVAVLQPEDALTPSKFVSGPVDSLPALTLFAECASRCFRSKSIGRKSSHLCEKNQRLLKAAGPDLLRQRDDITPSTAAVAVPEPIRTGERQSRSTPTEWAVSPLAILDSDPSALKHLPHRNYAAESRHING